MLYISAKHMDEIIDLDQMMDCMASADRGSRLIKGQVFLWESAKDWTDLWDVDGQITGSCK